MKFCQIQGGERKPDLKHRALPPPGRAGLSAHYLAPPWRFKRAQASVARASEADWQPTRPTTQDHTRGKNNLGQGWTC